MVVDNSANTIRTAGASIVINPGSGPVADSTVEYARANMQHLVLDAGLVTGHVLRNEVDDDRGRFGFLVWERNEDYEIRACTVQMPGIPLHQVRYMKEPGQDPWDFPCLYVDDSSWLWYFAVNCVKRAIRGEDPDGED